MDAAVINSKITIFSIFNIQPILYCSYDPFNLLNGNLIAKANIVSKIFKIVNTLNIIKGRVRYLV